MRAILGIAALVVNFIGYGPYIKGILNKKVKPHRVTWGIWTILTTIAAVNQVINGGGFSSLFFISTSLLVAITFLLSIKNGLGGVTKIDIICLVFAICLLSYWVFVKDTRLSTLLAVIIDCIAVIPTLIKIYRHPETEIYAQWVLAALGGFFALLATPQLDWALLIYPAYILIMNSIIVGIKYSRE